MKLTAIRGECVSHSPLWQEGETVPAGADPAFGGLWRVEGNACIIQSTVSLPHDGCGGTRATLPFCFLLGAGAKCDWAIVAHCLSERKKWAAHDVHVNGSGCVLRVFMTACPLPLSTPRVSDSCPVQSRAGVWRARRGLACDMASRLPACVVDVGTG